MKRIDAKFLIMGLVLLLAGLIFGRILILVAGVAFIIYSFFSKGMEPTKENIFKPKPILKKKEKSEQFCSCNHCSSCLAEGSRWNL